MAGLTTGQLGAFLRACEGRGRPVIFRGYGGIPDGAGAEEEDESTSAKKNTIVKIITMSEAGKEKSASWRPWPPPTRRENVWEGLPTPGGPPATTTIEES